MWAAGCSLRLSSQPLAVIVATVITDKLSVSQYPRIRRSASSVSVASISKADNVGVTIGQEQLSLLSSSTAAAPQPFVRAVKNPPELALLSLLFVLSTAIGAIFSLAVISIPTIIELKKLSASAVKLSKTVSEEVPGTLASLKLSGLEINELTQQLSNLRQKISGRQYTKKSRSNKPSSSASSRYPIVD